MPVKINYLQDGTGVEFIASGIVTGKEIIEANSKIYNRENLLQLRYKIVDRTTCTEYRVSTEEVQTIANQDKEAAKINPDMIIVLISKTALQYGVSRMWEAYINGTGFQTGLFEDRKTADAWLSARLQNPGNGVESN